MVSQMFPPPRDPSASLPHFLGGNPAGILWWEGGPKGATEDLEEVRALLTLGRLCEPESLNGPPHPRFLSYPAPPGCRALEDSTGGGTFQSSP